MEGGNMIVNKAAGYQTALSDTALFETASDWPYAFHG
jgi:hypothetical protein